MIQIVKLARTRATEATASGAASAKRPKPYYLGPVLGRFWAARRPAFFNRGTLSVVENDILNECQIVTGF